MQQHPQKMSDNNILLPSKQNFPHANSTTLNPEAEQTTAVVTQTESPKTPQKLRQRAQSSDSVGKSHSNKENKFKSPKSSAKTFTPIIIKSDQCPKQNGRSLPPQTVDQKSANKSSLQLRHVLKGYTEKWPSPP